MLPSSKMPARKSTKNSTGICTATKLLAGSFLLQNTVSTAYIPNDSQNSTILGCQFQATGSQRRN